MNALLFLFVMVTLVAVPVVSHVTCQNGDNSDVGGSFESCCKKASSGEQVTFVIDKSVDDVKPFEFPCDDSTLYVNQGVTLTSSIDSSEFKGAKAWIEGNSRKNIAVEGTGTIDGSGHAWWNRQDNLHDMFIFFEINGLTFTDINLQNSPQETLVARTGENWKIKNITITNPYGGAKNLDCIDVGGSNIVIKHCTLNCGDDNVAMKLDATNVIVEDCYFGTGHGASVGSVGSTTVKNITFSNIKMKNTVNGPRIKTLAGYSGGKVKDIYFEDFTMEKVKHDMVIDGLYHDNDKTPYGTKAPNLSPALKAWYEELRIRYEKPGSYTGDHTSSAAIENIYYKHISARDSGGTSRMECNPQEPCSSVLYEKVDLGSKTDADCQYIQDGVLEGTVTPSSLYKSSSCSFEQKN